MRYRKMSGQRGKCKVCDHPKIEAIEKAIAKIRSGRTRKDQREIAGKYGFTDRTLRTHINQKHKDTPRENREEFLDPERVERAARTVHMAIISPASTYEQIGRQLGVAASTVCRDIRWHLQRLNREAAVSAEELRRLHTLKLARFQSKAEDVLRARPFTHPGQPPRQDVFVVKVMSKDENGKAVEVEQFDVKGYLQAMRDYAKLLDVCRRDHEVILKAVTTADRLLQREADLWGIDAPVKFEDVTDPEAYSAREKLIDSIARRRSADGDDGE